MYFVKVLTLDTELEMSMKNSTTGMQLFNQVCETIGLREVWYFGMQYLDEQNDLIWLDLLKKIPKQLRHSKGPIQFYFRAKYFPEDATEELIYETTINLFYLQVKESILSEEIECPLETSILLASYACQAKFGDYNEESMSRGFLFREPLIPQGLRERSGLSLDELEQAVVQWYRQHQNMMRWDAMLEYLNIAQDLEMYAVTYFDIRNKKGTNLLLGVDRFGVNIYTRDNRLTPQLNFPWSEIDNVTFKRLKFIIIPVDKSSEKLVFFSNRLEHNQKLFSLCVGAHELYIRRRQPESIEIQHMRAQANAEREAKTFERSRLLNALRAQEDAEWQLKQLSVRLEQDANEKERTRQNALELAKRIEELENQLAEEAKLRKQLEDARQRLEVKNRELEVAFTQSKEHRLKLLQEQSVIQEEIEELSNSVEDSSIRLQTKRGQFPTVDTTEPVAIPQPRLSMIGQTMLQLSESNPPEPSNPPNSVMPLNSKPESDQSANKPADRTSTSEPSVHLPEPVEAKEMSNSESLGKMNSPVVDAKLDTDNQHREARISNHIPTNSETPRSRDISNEPNENQRDSLLHSTSLSLSSASIKSASSRSLSTSRESSLVEPIKRFTQIDGDRPKCDSSLAAEVIVQSPATTEGAPIAPLTTSNTSDCGELRFDLNYMYAVHPDTQVQRMSSPRKSVLLLGGRPDLTNDFQHKGPHISIAIPNNRHSMYTRIPSPLGIKDLESSSTDRPYSYYFDECVHYNRRERFPTLRRIRQGNTKRRVEEFESM